jgi:hypothetical protein
MRSFFCLMTTFLALSHGLGGAGLHLSLDYRPAATVEYQESSDTTVIRFQTNIDYGYTVSLALAGVEPSEVVLQILNGGELVGNDLLNLAFSGGGSEQIAFAVNTDESSPDQKVVTVTIAIN